MTILVIVLLWTAGCFIGLALLSMTKATPPRRD